LALVPMGGDAGASLLNPTGLVNPGKHGLRYCAHPQSPAHFRFRGGQASAIMFAPNLT